MTKKAPVKSSNTSQAETARLTIDELASQARVPSRTIRYYQSKCVLPKPEIEGRTAYYSDQHIERLNLIGQLQDRGLRIRAIRELIEKIESGLLDLGQWLGLEQQLHAPWSDDTPKLYSDRELERLLGKDAAPGAISRLRAMDLLERSGDRYLVRSPSLLKIVLDLHKNNIDLETSEEAGLIIRKHMSRLAEELSEFYLRKAGEGFGAMREPDAIGQALSIVRQKGLEAIRLIFSQEIEDTLHKLVESGKLSKIPLNKKQ